jgi:type III pantothenate kinase
MKYLAIDIGNTFVKFGLFKNEEPLEMTFGFPTVSLIAHENIEGELLPKLVTLGDLDGIAIASVVPKATDVLVKFLHGAHKQVKTRILTNTDIPIINSYYDPSQVGIDRLLSSLAAYHHWGRIEKKPVIVIGLGTATTIDCMNAEGEYLGGIITLGVEQSAKQLHQIAAQLPEIELVFPKHILGRSTVESIQSGILFGTVAMIEGLVVKLHEEVFPNQEIIVVATGGLSKLFENKTEYINHIASHLVLEGVAIVYNR